MQTILPSEIKRGAVLMLEGVPHLVEDFHVSGTAQTRHKLHCRLRNLNSNRFGERIFPENERLQIAEMQTRRVQMSYQQGEDYVFMDSESYEEMVVSKEQIGESRWFLRENDECRALFVEGKLQTIELPMVMNMLVTETAPGQKGGSMAAWKPAKLEGGLEIMVPLFIEKGDRIRVDTAERKYLGKETEEK